LKIKILEKNDTELRFLLEDSNPQFANALRRVTIGEIPILTIGTVDFTTNDSVLYNEIIAHRLGLIPIVFDTEDFELKEDSEEGSSSTEVIFAINKKGPGMVYSKDMKSSNPSVKPLYDNIPIVELFGDQKLKLEASATLGKGVNHARYQAASTFYRYYPSAKVNGKIANVDEVIRACPKDAIKFSDDKISVSDKCDLCQECVKAAKPEGALEIVGDDKKFLVTVESISGLRPEVIVLEAIEIIKKKAKEFDKEVKKL
jgi:DNA-directed RNA polymerase subunit D